MNPHNDMYSFIPITQGRPNSIYRAVLFHEKHLISCGLALHIPLRMRNLAREFVGTRPLVTALTRNQWFQIELDLTTDSNGKPKAKTLAGHELHRLNFANIESVEEC